MKFLIVDDEHELYKIMFSDLFKPSKYNIEEIPRLITPSFLRKFKEIHFNEKINRHFWIPGKSIWNKYYALSKYRFDENENYVIIFLNGTLRHYYSKDYLINLKKYMEVKNMKFKKVIGCLVLALTAVFVNTGQASLAFVGVEDMPKSMKENR